MLNSPNMIGLVSAKIIAYGWIKQPNKKAITFAKSNIVIVIRFAYDNVWKIRH